MSDDEAEEEEEDEVIHPARGGCSDWLVERLLRFDGPSMPLNDVIEQAQTGDILLWRGNGGWWTEFWTGSPFTHVSMVYCDPQTGKKYQWQCTTNPEETDLLTGEFNRNGTQLTYLRESIVHYAKEYGNLICWRPIMFFDTDLNRYTREIPPEALHTLNKSVVDIMKHAKGFGYDHDFRDMISGAAFCLYYCFSPLGRKPDFNRRMFCSPLVALTLQRAGVLYKGVPIQNYSPASFDYSTDTLNITDQWGFGRTLKIAFD